MMLEKEVLEQIKSGFHNRKTKDGISIRNSVKIPLFDGEFFGEIFTFDGTKTSGEHIAVALGPWQKNAIPLVRLHSECLTGDVFGSQRCDCKPQLHEALRVIHQEGGVLLYLRQEGRGIGLYHKIDAYALQDKGLDTYQANRALSLPDDSRDYKIAADMLTAMQIKKIFLLSNNPQKEQQLIKYGIEVSKRHTTQLHVNEHNYDYLLAKANFGHDLNFFGEVKND